MSRSARPFDDAGHRRRWGASVVGSLLGHAGAVALLAGAVYEVTARPEGPKTVRDVSMTLRSGSVDQFIRQPTSSVTPLNTLMRDVPAGVPGLAGLDRTPDLATIMAQLREQTVGVSALGVLTQSSNSALAGSAALAPGGGDGGAGGVSASSVVFAGLSASGEQAKSVVYVVDASGPMVSSLPEVFAELMRSVDALQPTQQFGVVLFRQTGDTRSSQFSPSLVDATATNRTALRVWLSGVNATGRSNPLDGLRAGLSMRPQAIFLLSRSIPRTAGNPWEAAAGGPEAIIRELEQLNPAISDGSRSTVIKTLQFLEPDPSGVMERIGRLHGGADQSTPPFRIVRREDLSRR